MESKAASWRMLGSLFRMEMGVLGNKVGFLGFNVLRLLSFFCVGASEWDAEIET